MFGVLDRSCVESPCYENDAFRILMLLYYCCGLRKAEAQELKLGDINFEKGKITILHGKNDVARIIRYRILFWRSCGCIEKTT